jgi:hypothetical protein
MGTPTCCASASTAAPATTEQPVAPQAVVCASASSPSSRSRCSPSRTSCRVASTNRRPGGARMISSSSCRSASGPSSCTSSTTSHNRSSSGARSVSSRSVIAHPSRSGATVSSRTSADPTAVCRNAASTDSQNPCEPRSPRPAGTHAALPGTPAWLIHDRSSTVLPLPGGADTTLTLACAPSRPTSRGRDTTYPAPGLAAPPAAAATPVTDPIAAIIASHQPARPVGRRPWLACIHSSAARYVLRQIRPA